MQPRATVRVSTCVLGDSVRHTPADTLDEAALARSAFSSYIYGVLGSVAHTPYLCYVCLCAQHVHDCQCSMNMPQKHS